MDSRGDNRMEKECCGARESKQMDEIPDQKVRRMRIKSRPKGSQVTFVCVCACVCARACVCKPLAKHDKVAALVFLSDLCLQFSTHQSLSNVKINGISLIIITMPHRIIRIIYMDKKLIVIIVYLRQYSGQSYSSFQQKVLRSKA